jgi:peptide-methionine (S)-S-oxide reductase
VGYAGGTSASPSYDHIGDHSETIRVGYDPSIITFDQLLTAFWSGHDPTVPEYTRQYRSAIFYVNEQQQMLAVTSKQAREAALGRTILTSIEPLVGFTAAEDYHQKYYLRQRPDIVDAIYAIYPDPIDFRNSTAAARLNGYLGGYGDAAILAKHINELGLSESGKKALMQAIESGLSPFCPLVPPSG